MSLPAARLGASVLATDWAPTMIEHFNARADAEGLDAVGCVMDCHALEIADDTYDLTGSQFGVMLVPDQAQALREMVRVTKPGGRVLLIAYGNPGEFEALHLFIGAVQAVVPEFEGPAEDEPMLEFQVADPEVLRQRLTDAGLKDVSVDTGNRSGSRSGPDSSSGTGASVATRSRRCSSPTSPRHSARTSSGRSTRRSANAPPTARPC
jgi:ubiquinone/menaquinone biosynthesis C-methylase UbiE